MADGYLELIAEFAENWGDTMSPDVERITGLASRTVEQVARDFAPASGGVAQPGC